MHNNVTTHNTRLPSWPHLLYGSMRSFTVFMLTAQSVCGYWVHMNLTGKNTLISDMIYGEWLSFWLKCEWNTEIDGIFFHREKGSSTQTDRKGCCGCWCWCFMVLVFGKNGIDNIMTSRFFDMARSNCQKPIHKAPFESLDGSRRGEEVIEASGCVQLNIDNEFFENVFLLLLALWWRGASPYVVGSKIKSLQTQKSILNATIGRE